MRIKIFYVILLIFSSIFYLSAWHIDMASYLGDQSSDEGVYAVRILSTDDIIIGAELGADTQIIKNANKSFIRESSKKGVLLLLSNPDYSIKCANVISTNIKDMAVDTQDQIYVACGTEGIKCISADLKNILWTALEGKYTHRVDIGKDGTVAVLAEVDEKFANSKSGPGVIYVFDSKGNLINSFPGVGIEQHERNVLDICVHSESKTIICVGWRQAADWSERANRGGPVQIAFVRGLSYDGKVKWNAYDWSVEGQSEKYLNKPENNMADTRALRCCIGDDGKLYVVYGVAGGNHIFRYSPFDIMKKVNIPKGDSFTDFSASKSEHKTFFGRYNPANGEYEIGQQLTARISTQKTNTLWCEEGEIFADAQGRVYLVGFSAYGLPIWPNKMLQPDAAKKTFNPFGANSYLGGPFIIINSSNFIDRDFVARISQYGGLSRSVYAKKLKNGQTLCVWGGTVKLEGPAYTKKTLQNLPGFGENDAFAAVLIDSPGQTEELLFSQNLLFFDLQEDVGKKRTFKIRDKDPEFIQLSSDANQKIVSVEYSWDENTPLTPANSSADYKGQALYGGLSIRILNPSADRNKVDKGTVECPFNLTYTVKARGEEKLQLRGAVFIKTHEIPDAKPEDKFSFDTNSILNIVMPSPCFYTYPWIDDKGKENWKVHNWIKTQFRWLVKDSDKFYLSKKTVDWTTHQDNFLKLSFDSDADDGEWAEWQPSANFEFNAESAKFAKRNFENIQGIGFWIFDPEFRPTKESLEAGKNAPKSIVAGLQIKEFHGSIAKNKGALNRPVAKFTFSPKSPAIGDKVEFDSSGSEAGDGYINFYAWDFCDGTKTSGVKVSHTFNDSGKNRVRLKIWNDQYQVSDPCEKIIQVFPADLTEVQKASLVAVFGGRVIEDMPKIERNENLLEAISKDLNNDNIPDMFTELAFDEKIPFSVLPGTKLYAGWIAESLMPVASQKGRHINNYLNIYDHAKYKKKDTQGRYTLGYGTRMEVPGRVRFIAVIKKEDFLNGFDDSAKKVALTTNSELVAGPFAEIPTSMKIHFVLKDGNEYWVSENFYQITEKLDPQIPFSKLPVFRMKIGAPGEKKTKWAKIDPFKSLEIPSNKSFVNRMFNNVMAFGILGYNETIDTHGEFQVYGLSLFIPNQSKR